jgi:hypothetical protein
LVAHVSSVSHWQNGFLQGSGGMAVNIKSPRVDELIGQLRQLTGRGATEIVREAQARPFAAESLYDSEGLPG